MNGSLVGQTNTRDLYWTFEQMIAHHTSNGCNLEAGDLLRIGNSVRPKLVSAASSNPALIT